jgi:phospholipid/cholesterol/gamma-HCH transport system substrate-binding protein
VSIADLNAPLARHLTMLPPPRHQQGNPGAGRTGKAILANVEHITRKDGEVNASLANIQTVTGRMTGEYGMLESVLGSPEKARSVTDSLEQTRALIGKLDSLALKMDSMAGKTDQWLFAPNGG